MKLILLGPPGAGKGTQADTLAKKYNIPHISTGDILRVAVNTGTELGLKVKAILDAGNLVSDDIMINLIKERLSQSDCENGFLLDGYPRTIPQADSLRAADIDIDFVIEINLADAEIIKRISGRRVDPTSGRTYNIYYNPPKVAGKDDISGNPLIHRSDDHEDVVRDRLQVYRRQTFPLIEYYKNLYSQNGSPIYVVVDGSQSIKAVTNAILEKLAEE